MNDTTTPVERLAAPAGSPMRVRLSRAKGWRLPPNTVVVSRPSRWGNPYKVGRDGGAEECVRKYAAAMFRYTHAEGSIEDLLLDELTLDDLASLRGKNLACWCLLDQPCHADVLLRLANSNF